MLENLYEMRIDSPRSENYYADFDTFSGQVMFSLYDGENGDCIKTYTVDFCDDGSINDDIEWENDYDDGYCCYNRLPRELRAHIEAIITAYLIEEAQD